MWHHRRPLCFRNTLTWSPNVVLTWLSHRLEWAQQHQKSLWGQGTMQGDQSGSKRALGQKG